MISLHCIKPGELQSSSSRDYEVKIFNFCDDMQKLACFLRNISKFAGSIFTKFSLIVDTWVYMNNMTFVLWSLNGCCYGNQLIFGQKTLISLSFFVLVFNNGLEYRHLNVCVNSGNDASTSCENLVNFGPVTL